MSKNPAYPMYAQDFDMDTKSWTALEVGVYIRLLNYEWVNGSLPNTISELSRIAQIDRRNMQKMWSVVMAKKFTVDAAGMYINRRMEEEREKQRNYSEIQTKKGINGANKRWSKPIAPAIAQAQPDDSSSFSSSFSLKKKEKKDTKKRNFPPNGEPPKKDFLTEIKNNPAYQHINIENELSKMDAWLLLPKNKGRQKTPRFILNWLNKIEKPIGGNNHPNDRYGVFT